MVHSNRLSYCTTIHLHLVQQKVFSKSKNTISARKSISYLSWEPVLKYQDSRLWWKTLWMKRDRRIQPKRSCRYLSMLPMFLRPNGNPLLITLVPSFTFDVKYPPNCGIVLDQCDAFVNRVITQWKKKKPEDWLQQTALSALTNATKVGLSAKDKNKPGLRKFSFLPRSKVFLKTKRSSIRSSSLKYKTIKQRFCIFEEIWDQLQLVKSTFKYCTHVAKHSTRIAKSEDNKNTWKQARLRKNWTYRSDYIASCSFLWYDFIDLSEPSFYSSDEVEI